MRRFVLGLGAALLIAAIAAPVASAAANREVLEKNAVATLHFEGLDACVNQGYAFTAPARV